MTTRNSDRHMFSASMKLADLIDIDFNLLGVFSRMGLRFGFGDETVEEACKKNSVDPETFLLICGVYSIDGYMPSKDALGKVDVEDIVKYLHQSHSYYMDVTMKTLADSIERMMEPCGEKHKAIIWKFFSEYKEELSKHFQYEEEVVFPHVCKVLAHSSDGFTINQYEENHSNVDEKLGDLKNIVMKYLPQECDSQQINNVLMNLYSFENDLAKHTIIEDGILVPVVNRLESNEKQ